MNKESGRRCQRLKVPGSELQEVENIGGFNTEWFKVVNGQVFTDKCGILSLRLCEIKG